MRILFVVPYAPSLIRVRPYNLIRALVARGHALTVATPWTSEAEQKDLAALERLGISIVAEPLTQWRSLWNSFKALPTREPLQAHYCWQPALARRIASELRKQRYDVAHVEHLRGARYGLALKSCTFAPGSQTPSPGSTNLPMVWDSVDCISHLFGQAAERSESRAGRAMTRLELGRTRHYEGWLVGQFCRVLVTSEVDEGALSRLANGRSGIADGGSWITVLPNGVDLDYFSPGQEAREPETLVFSGKMSYHANVTAVLHLVRDIMPHVWARRPHVNLWIVGKDPTREIRGLAAAEPRIYVTGTVPDLRPYLWRATLAVVPTLYGAGIQNKVLEAMACGAPVVASPQAVSALSARDGHHLLLAEGREAVARALLELLTDPERRGALGKAGRRYVEACHDWNSIASRLEAIYHEVIVASSSAPRAEGPGEERI